MTPEELNEIERRARDEWHPVERVEADVMALVAEVRSLREQLADYQRTLEVWEDGTAARLLISERDDLREQLARAEAACAQWYQCATHPAPASETSAEQLAALQFPNTSPSSFLTPAPASEPEPEPDWPPSEAARRQREVRAVRTPAPEPDPCGWHEGLQNYCYVSGYTPVRECEFCHERYWLPAPLLEEGQ